MQQEGLCVASPKLPYFGIQYAVPVQRELRLNALKHGPHVAVPEMPFVRAEALGRREHSEHEVAQNFALASVSLIATTTLRIPHRCRAHHLVLVASAQ